MVSLICAHGTLAAEPTQTLSALCAVRKGLSDKWSIDGIVRCGLEHCVSNRPSAMMRLTANFNFMGRARLMAGGEMGARKYWKYDDTDLELTLMEGLSIDNSIGLTHSVVFAQKRLKVIPDGYTASMSRVAYSASLCRQLAQTPLKYTAALRLAMNINNDAAGDNAIQRASLSVGLRRTCGRTNEVGVSYSYSLFGDRQAYIFDRPRQHTITLEFSL